VRDARKAAWGTVSAGNLGETGNRGKEPAMRGMLRRLGLAVALTAVTLANTGCIINQYPADPNERLHVLFNESENLRQLRQEWLRFWQIDMPSHLTPERVDGGIYP
jgi:hypothetical protein